MLPPQKKDKSADLYSIIGVEKNAQNDEIKSAYHKRAKETHPDINQSILAEREFYELSNAYKILSNPQQKRTYDITSNIDNLDFADDDIKCCSLCKTKTHNLRFIIFKEVTNKKLRAVSKTIQGVFCLKCANDVAVRASMRTWLSGFWLFPIGTFFSFIALANNITGGKKPNKLNARLLINHARKLVKSGELEKAKFIAQEALKFSKIPEHIQITKAILENLNATKAKKDNWSKLSTAFLVQISPFIMFFTLVAIMFYFYKTPQRLFTDYDVTSFAEQENLKVVKLPDNPSDENLVYKVKSANISVHQGPSLSFGVIGNLVKGTKFRIVGIVPSTLWVKIKTEEFEGFVISEFIEKNADM